MSLSHHRQRQLYLIESGLLRADPQLTAMLGIFGKLSEGQAMPYLEQVPTGRDRIRQAAALTAQAITVVGAAIGLLLRAVLALVMSALTVTCGSPGGPTPDLRRHPRRRPARRGR